MQSFAGAKPSKRRFHNGNSTITTKLGNSNFDAAYLARSHGETATPASSTSSPTVGSRLSALTPTLLLVANPACTPSKPVGGWSPPAKASCSPSVISRLASIAGSLSSKVLFLRCELLLQISNSLLTRHLGTTSRKLIGCSKMADQQTVGDLKEKLATQARTFEKRLSAIEASREITGGLQEASAGGDQPPTGFEGVQAGFAASSSVGVNADSLLPTVGDEVEIAGGGSLAARSREISSRGTRKDRGGKCGVEQE